MELSTTLEHLGWKVFYLAGLVGAIVIEHRLFARRWRRYERARWTMGVATVLAWGLPLALRGMLDFGTLAWLTVAFGVAGATVTALYTDEGSRINAQARSEIRKAGEADE